MQKTIIALITVSAATFSVAAETVNGLTASELKPLMGVGINIGNTLEAIGGETAWGADPVNRDYLHAIKQAGYSSVRIPCSWNIYLDADGNIDPTWLDRVYEVVGYAIDEDLYVVLNDHWDNGWLENDIPNGYKTAKAENLKNIWTQIATKFEPFDQHLLFAGLNEPNCDSSTHSKTLQKYEQDFVDAVRATGGNNVDRVLVVQGPGTDVEKTVNYKFVLPTDTSSDRLMVEVHFYSPYNFCLMENDESWGNTFWFWGKSNHVSGSAHNPTWGEETWVDGVFANMKAMFSDKNVPIVLGEYACMEREALEGTSNWAMHQQSRYYWAEYITRQSLLSGMIPFYWDTPYKGIFNRADGALLRPEMIDAMQRGYQAASVDNVEVNPAEQPAEYYNLQGVKVDETARGIVIRVAGGSAEKLVVK